MRLQRRQAVSIFVCRHPQVELIYQHAYHRNCRQRPRTERHQMCAGKYIYCRRFLQAGKKILRENQRKSRCLVNHRIFEYNGPAHPENKTVFHHLNIHKSQPRHMQCQSVMPPEQMLPAESILNKSGKFRHRLYDQTSGSQHKTPVTLNPFGEPTGALRSQGTVLTVEYLPNKAISIVIIWLQTLSAHIKPGVFLKGRITMPITLRMDYKNNSCQMDTCAWTVWSQMRIRKWQAP